MNLPNKITLTRVILIPFFIVAFYLYYSKVESGNANSAFMWAAFAIFVIASLTDFLDGYLARKNNLVTDFGKFADPLADKILVMSAMLLYVQYDKIAAWIVIVIIAREFVISGFRMIAAEKGIVIAAGWWGKIKTAETMVALVLIMFFDALGLDASVGTGLYWFEQILIYLALLLTVISMIDYFRKNKGVIASF